MEHNPALQTVDLTALQRSEGFDGRDVQRLQLHRVYAHTVVSGRGFDTRRPPRLQPRRRKRRLGETDSTIDSLVQSLKDLHNKMFFYYIRNTAMLKRHLRQKEGADLPGDKYPFATLDYLYDMYDHVFDTLRKETHTTLRFTGKAITPPEHRPKGLDEAIASVLQDIRRVHGQLGQALGSAAMKARAARGAEADRPRQFYYDFATLDYLYRVFDDLDKGMRAHSLLEMQDFEQALLSSPGQLKYFIRRR